MSNYLRVKYNVWWVNPSLKNTLLKFNYLPPESHDARKTIVARGVWQLFRGQVLKFLGSMVPHFVPGPIILKVQAGSIGALKGNA